MDDCQMSPVRSGRDAIEAPYKMLVAGGSHMRVPRFPLCPYVLYLTIALVVVRVAMN